ncbi:unnamed protein product [Caenorhabditis brenneri]
MDPSEALQNYAQRPDDYPLTEVTVAQEAQAKIKDLDAQMAQMRLSEESQAQAAIEAQEEIRSLRAQAQESQEAHAKTQEFLAQELKTAQAKIVNLEARMVKARAFFAEVEVETISEPIDQTQELKAKIESLEIQVAQMKVVEQFQAQSQEFSVAHAKITELEAQMAVSEKDSEERICLLNSEIRDQAQELQVAQAKIKDLDTQAQCAQAQAQEARSKITDLEAQIAQMRLSEQSQAQAAISEKLVKAEAKIKDLEAQVTKPSVEVSLSSEWYAPKWKLWSQLFRIEQNGLRSYFKSPVSKDSHLFCKFVPDETVTLDFAATDCFLTCWFRVSVSDGKRWTTIGHLGPENPKMPIWKWMLRRAPSRINADGDKEYKLVICCETLADDPTNSSH